MKCSLLTLSTFIDDSLPTDRAAEVDAHLVACPRCSAGVTTLREERDRVGSLARVRVDWESAQSLLEQVGIGATTGPAPVRRERAAPTAAPTRPWLSAGRGAALPWSPQRPAAPATPTIALTEEADVQTVSPDVQPDLPFDGHLESSATASPEVEAVGRPQASAPATDWGTDLTDEPAAPLEDWEAAIPAYEDTADAWAAPPAVTPSWDEPPAWTDPEPAAPVAEAPVVSEPVAPQPPMPAPPVGPPQRLEPASGAGALLGRARDFVSVRLALARSHPADDADLDTLPPVAQPPLVPVRSVEAEPMPPSRPAMPMRGFETPDVAAALPVAPPVEPAPVEPAPIAPPVAPVAPAPFTPAAARAEAIRALRNHDDERQQAAGVPEEWNAFGAAAYRRAAEPAAPAKPQKVGRHLKQARQQPVPFRTRVAPVLAAISRMAASAGAGAVAGARVAGGAARVAGTRAASTVGSAASAGARTATSGARSSTLNWRVAAAGAGAVVIFLLALFVGRGGSTTQPNTHTASHGGPAATTATQGQPSAGTQSNPATSAPSTTTTTPVTGVQTYGAGATGVSLQRVRYGVFNGSQRLVFDMSGAAGPTTTVGFSNPTTLVITFKGASPPASWAAPPAGGVVTAIRTTSSGGGSTTVTLTLAHAVNPVALYLTGPERFVLDLH